MSTYYTCDEVAAMFKVKTLTVWDWIRHGRLPATKIGKSYRMTDEDIKKFEAKGRNQDEQTHNL